MTKTSEATWTTSKGAAAKVVVTLTTTERVNLDGYISEINKVAISIDAYLNDVDQGSGRPQSVNHPVAVAKIGKMGLAQDSLDKVNAAIAEIEAAPEWVAHQAQIDRNLAECAEYDKHSARMHRAMAE